MEVYSIGIDKAQQIAQDARILDQHYTGHSYTDQTRAGGSLSVGMGSGSGSSSKGSKSIVGKIVGMFNGGVGINGSVESSNALNYGDSTQSSSSNSIAETERSFNSSIKDIASSNRNDEVTQLARDHVDTLSKIMQYSQEKAFNEHMAKSYQESYNRASSMTFSERRNLTDAAFEIATKEKGYTMSEASRMTRSQQAKDRAIVQSWFDTAKAREESRNHPTMPTMRQEMKWNEYDGQTAQDEIKTEFLEEKRQTQNKLDDYDNKIKTNAEKARIHIASKQNTDIEQKRSDIEVKMAEVQQKEKIRSNKGSWKAAWDKLTKKE